MRICKLNYAATVRVFMPRFAALGSMGAIYLHGICLIVSK